MLVLYTGICVRHEIWPSQRKNEHLYRRGRPTQNMNRCYKSMYSIWSIPANLFSKNWQLSLLLYIYICIAHIVCLYLLERLSINVLNAAIDVIHLTCPVMWCPLPSVSLLAAHKAMTSVFMFSFFTFSLSLSLSLSLLV